MMAAAVSPLTVPSYAKINLTLRIGPRRPDGYHELTSLVWRTPPVESLTIAPAARDALSVTGCQIEGENVLVKALRMIRAEGENVPPLATALDKRVPPGSGLGAGSGNGAAFLHAIETLGFQIAVARDAAGADGYFFLSGAQTALMRGIGNDVTPCRAAELSCIAVCPNWPTNTARAYARLDGLRAKPQDMEEAQREAMRVLDALCAGEKVGLLPNDFLALAAERAEYGELFAAFSDAGALAWGLTGSGSAAFGVWPFGKAPELELNEPWIRTILRL